MSAAQLERLQDSLARLRLIKIRERLEALLQEASSPTASATRWIDCEASLCSKTRIWRSFRTSASMAMFWHDFPIACDMIV